MKHLWSFIIIKMYTFILMRTAAQALISDKYGFNWRRKVARTKNRSPAASSLRDKCESLENRLEISITHGAKNYLSMMN